MASNNFYLNSDPLLFSTQLPYQKTEEDMKQQLNDSMIQYRALQQQQQLYQKDYLGELDKTLKGLGGTALNQLNADNEYVKLNSELQSLIQTELLSTIKIKLNCNPMVSKNIERQIEIINKVNSEIEDEQRKNLTELNDYVKNYSNITFNEYKKLKNRPLKNYESTRDENKNRPNGKQSN